MCEERSDEQKVLLLKRGGTLFLSSLQLCLLVAFTVASFQPSFTPAVLRSSSDLTFSLFQKRFRTEPENPIACTRTHLIIVTSGATVSPPSSTLESVGEGGPTRVNPIFLFLEEEKSEEKSLPAKSFSSDDEITSGMLEGGGYLLKM